MAHPFAVTHTRTLRKASIVQAMVGLRHEHSHLPQPPSFKTSSASARSSS
ncbi:Protein of unknown function [Pyronema omphalodes CBS 100304]|uniref:Uncharacterized protein n=1 Tax=Pyronema omphalodes (strain CBS 100304) TaxID=1076935 RepID=U4LDV2_PYROM|nr:Protein of unknown function [Pyronema omphalodes CBS 100304]